ncbi:MAG: CDGSH iron-sulfur domain-containing protein [Methanomassiliicoccaceae archaeon]|nr:CDGSH iron-sulfur domain-containing protein [Methanomassiliicoccaceae archaeon]
MKIDITKDGPYIVTGNVPLKEESIKKDAMGRPDKWVEGKTLYSGPTYTLCRCGRSTDMPFCTGAHTDFDGTETAERNTFDEKSQVYPGAGGVELLQAPSFCVGDGFCHAKNSITQMIKKEKTLDIALQQTYDCSGGSLLIKIDGKEQEPQLQKSISATGNPPGKGPLIVKGGIPIVSSDGYTYEVRNRVALCSCGRSGNKPFCDATHLR